MAKIIPLYSAIYSYSADQFVRQLADAAGEDVVVRINCPGGDVFAGWSMIAALLEYEGNVSVKVDGFAASMASLFPVFFEDVECLDVSKIMIHRAVSYDDTEEGKQLLASVNKQLRTKLNARINNEKLKELKGVTIDELFDATDRIDMWLTASEAKKVGLVKKVNRMQPKELQALEASVYSIAASMGTGEPPAKPTPTSTQQNNHKMTLADLKAQHPEIYAQAVQEGVTKERDRVGALMAFKDIDAEAVAKAVEEGTEYTAKFGAEMTAKALSKTNLENLKKDNPKAVTTTDAPDEGGEGADATLDEFKKNVSAMLGKNK